MNNPYHITKPNKSAPISIPQSNESTVNKIEYNLNTNCINPTKNSPPNSWNTRLEKRYKSYFENKYPTK